MNNATRFMVSWGPMLNLSTGNLVIEEETFSLVPNDAMTAVTLSVGNAYSTKSFPIEDIVGYKNGFMAWMAIILKNGEKIKISVGTKNKKKEIVAALELQRNAVFSAKGHQHLLCLLQSECLLNV